jgi:predicted nucleic acid-binding protein
MILVDTTVWIDYFNGNYNAKTDLLDYYLENDLIIIGDLILIELLQGFKLEKDYNIAKKLLDDLIYVDLAGKDIAEESIKNYRLLRKNGITVRKTIDMIIASYCIKNKIRLLHNDKDFDSIGKYLTLDMV